MKHRMWWLIVLGAGMASEAMAQGPIIGSSLDRLFYVLDDNHDGAINRDEARRSPVLSQYFAEADTSADDLIDRVEFAVFETNSGGGGGGLPAFGGAPGTVQGPPVTGAGGTAGDGVGGAVPGPAPAGTPPPNSSDSTATDTGGGGLPAGTPPPTSSGPSSDSLTSPDLPAGTPPPPSSRGSIPVPGTPRGGAAPSGPLGRGGAGAGAPGVGRGTTPSLRPAPTP